MNEVMPFIKGGGSLASRRLRSSYAKAAASSQSHAAPVSPIGQWMTPCRYALSRIVPTISFAAIPAYTRPVCSRL